MLRPAIRTASPCIHARLYRNGIRQPARDAHVGIFLREPYPQSPVLRASDAEIRPDPSATTTHPKIRHSNNTFPLDGQPRRAGRDHLCPR